jgi:hypothetical protein
LHLRKKSNTINCASTVFPEEGSPPPFSTVDVLLRISRPVTIAIDLRITNEFMLGLLSLFNARRCIRQNGVRVGTASTPTI